MYEFYQWPFGCPNAAAFISYGSESIASIKDRFQEAKRALEDLAIEIRYTNQIGGETFVLIVRNSADARTKDISNKLRAAWELE